MDEAHKQETHHHHNVHVLLPLLQSLKKASKDLHINPLSNLLYHDNSKSAIEALLELGTKADAIVSQNPTLYINLSPLLTNLRTLLQKLEKLQSFNLRSLFFRPITNYKIFQTARAIESEIESYIDREIVFDVVTNFGKSTVEINEKLKILIEFRNRVSKGFDGDFQELVLRGRVFSVIESVLSESVITSSKRVRNEAALLVLALVEFNKDVFVGLVLMGPTIRALISIASTCSIRVLSSLIRFIKTPLVDEMEANREIPRIINLLSSEDFQVRIAALNCVFEIAFFGREEVIEAMLEENLVKKLVDLQRMMERESDLVEVSRLSELEIGEEEEEEEERDEVKLNSPGENCVARFLVQTQVNSPWENCVAKFLVQTQVGEGLEKREKKEFKLKIMKMVREASASDAEVAAIVAEVLWGSSP